MSNQSCDACRVHCKQYVESPGSTVSCFAWEHQLDQGLDVRHTSIRVLSDSARWLLTSSLLLASASDSLTAFFKLST